MKSITDLIAESGRDPAGVKTRYIYDFAHLAENRGRKSSAMVTPQISPLPNASAAGALVTGETLHVALLRYARGSADKRHSHPNEQFTFVVEGAVRAEIDGEETLVGKHCVAHFPASMLHRLSAAGDGGALVVTLQDTRHAFAG